MSDNISIDPFFDDEDEENEEVYRTLIINHRKLPPCDPSASPFSSFFQPSILCSRLEAENILKTYPGVQPGHFIVRPSANVNHPYSLSVLSDDKNIFHFQIGKISNEYMLGPLEKVDHLTTKTFRSLSTFLEYYSKNPIQFQDPNHKKCSIILKLYSIAEVTQF